MNTRPKLLYPSLIMAAVAVTLLSVTGIAALTGHLPSANAAADEAQKAQMAQAAARRDEAPVGQPPGPDQAAVCKVCGVVESVRAVESRGQGSGLGAVAGGVAGAILGNQMGNGNGRTVMTLAGAGGGAYLGNEIEKNRNKSVSYQIRVRMDAGGVRVLHQHEAPSVGAGDRVRISNGVAVLAG